MTDVKPHFLFHEIISFICQVSNWNPNSVLLSQAFVLAALFASQLTPNFPNDDSGLGIYCFFNQQAVTDRIRSFNNGTFACVGVDASIMLIDYQIFAKFVEISCMLYLRHYHFFCAKNSQLFKIQKKNPLCIL